MEIVSLGHSNLDIDDFIAFLMESGILRLADVRRFPASRRHPNFCKEPLRAALSRKGIAYRHYEDLGGFRDAHEESRHAALSDPGKQGYADHMDTPRFKEALADLMEWADRPLALMCAEAKPDACHRFLLCDALVDRGVLVRHLAIGIPPRVHIPSHSARLSGDGPIYDRGLLPFN